ncbi:four-carbon acid sugar kinase family protein [Paenarthrobacter nitroguajacolicus]|uniref:four-carbon acid sugar kinase family protein n=1 Tax=Paenarthrobacter nitroguajacolicus TaxID=211146 RepID=UPI00285637DF|nr:four-carbon acid sugar kinase family protein [Paenarthrobacter nitroguajacolicus]MDR6639454.1 hypothetical protein [Paenarthrobacter nitroguajacolicus]
MTPPCAATPPSSHTCSPSRSLGHTGESIDGIVLVPAFPEAGRITVDGVHYAGSSSDGFTPIGDTEFARDATFGYRSSLLAQWVEETTDGKISASSVLTINRANLRTSLPSVVATCYEPSLRSRSPSISSTRPTCCALPWHFRRPEPGEVATSTASARPSSGR